MICANCYVWFSRLTLAEPHRSEPRKPCRNPDGPCVPPEDPAERLRLQDLREEIQAGRSYRILRAALVLLILVVFGVLFAKKVHR
jgi:hypothetical protein